MYRVKRQELRGTPLARHSMNQGVMKRVKSGEREFYRNRAPASPARPTLVTASGVPLFDSASLARLVRTGIYGTGPTAELAAITHSIGSILNRIRPLQAANTR